MSFLMSAVLKLLAFNDTSCLWLSLNVCSSCSYCHTTVAILNTLAGIQLCDAVTTFKCQYCIFKTAIYNKKYQICLMLMMLQNTKCTQAMQILYNVHSVTIVSNQWQCRTLEINVRLLASARSACCMRNLFQYIVQFL